MEIKDKFDFDEKFQNSLINLMMIDREFYYQYSEHIKPTYFTTIYNVIIVKKISKFYTEFKKIPLYEELSNSVSDFRRPEEVIAYHNQLQIIKESNTTTIDFIKREILSFCKRQKLLTALHEAPDLVDRNELDKIKVLVDEAVDLGHIKKDTYNYFDERNIKDRLTSNYRETLPTLIPDLDAVLSGGLAKGELGMIVAPPKRGKSTSLVNIATAALYKSKFVVYITLEMSERQVANKFDSRLTGKSDVTLPENHTVLDEKMKKVHKIGCELVIERFPPMTLTTELLRKSLDYIALKRSRPIDMVVVDYLSIMKTKTGVDSPEALAQVAAEMRAIAIELNIPIWTAQQTNRGGSDKETIEQGDIAGSFPVYGVVDFAMSLNQTKAEAENGIARYFIQANRVGPTSGYVLISMKPNICLIQPRNTPEDNSNQ